MIVIKLVGGLASQLHKYAVIKSIAIKYNREFKVDLSAYENIKENDAMNYGLHNIGIEPLEASKKNIKDSKSLTTLGRFLYFIVNFLKWVPFFGNYSRKVLRKLEAMPTTRKLIAKSILTIHVSNSSTLDWIEEIVNNENSYIYAEFGLRFDIIESIRSDLKEAIVNAKISDHAKFYRDQIEESTISVSMHVRRGDYVTNKRTNDFHGVCGEEYYRKAIGKYENLGKSTFFVFSDDLDWVKQEFRSLFPKDTVFVSDNENFEDFSLMTSCTNHIIANSGFSAVSAWLSCKNESNITSPARWFKDEETNKNQMAMLPQDWLFL